MAEGGMNKSAGWTIDYAPDHWIAEIWAILENRDIEMMVVKVEAVQ